MSIFFGSGEFFTNLNGNEEEGSEFEILVQAYLRDVHYTSKNRAILNVVYATINAGLVALPMVTEYAGLPLFVFGVSAVALSSGYTTCMVINMANEQGVRMLEDLGEKAFGRNGFIFVCVFQVLFSLSLMCVTLDVFGEICANALLGFVPDMSKQHHVLWIHIRMIALLIGAVVILPICLMSRSMAHLSWSSYFSVIAIATAMCSLITAFSVSNGPNEVYGTESIRELMMPKKLAWTLALVAAFCFANNQKVFTVYSCLRRRSSARWAYVVKRAYLIVALFYIIFGVFGYLSDLKLNRTLSNINYFLEFSEDGAKGVYFNILSLIVAFSLLLTMPVDCLVAATTLKRLSQKIFGRRKRKSLYSNVCCCWYCCALGLHTIRSTTTKSSTTTADSQLPGSQVTTDLSRHAYSRLSFPDEATGCDNPECGENFDRPARHEVCTGVNGKYSEANLGPQLEQESGSKNKGWQTLADVSSLARSPKRQSQQSFSDNSGSHQSIKDLEGGMAEIGSARENGERGGSIEAVGRVSASSLCNNGHRANSSERSEDCPSSSSFSSSNQDVLGPLPNMSSYPVGNTSSVSNTSKNSSFDGDMPDKRGHSYSEAVSSDLAWREARSVAGSSGRPSVDPVFERASEDGDATESFLPVRQSSLGMVMEQPLAKKCTCADVAPVLGLWFVALLLCASYNKFGVLAIMLGPIAASVLMFLFPSMLYFRLGLTTDYATTPICGIIPNRAYMHIMQVLGLLFLVGNIAAVLYTFIADPSALSI